MSELEERREQRPQQDTKYWGNHIESTTVSANDMHLKSAELCVSLCERYLGTQKKVADPTFSLHMHRGKYGKKHKKLDFNQMTLHDVR